MQQIQSNQLEWGVLAPGNYKYYGTDGVWAKAFQDLDTSILALWYTPTGVGWPVKAGSFTRNMADASNTQTIAHWLWVAPRYIKFSYSQLQWPTVQISCSGIWDWTNDITLGAIWDSWLWSIAAWLDATKSIRYHTAELPYVTGEIGTVDATNFDITWVKNNSPTGSLLVLWEAYA